MIEQIIKFSDGTETVIKYRGVIENGVLTLDEILPETISASEEVPIATSEVSSSEIPIKESEEEAEEAPAESVEEPA